MLRRITPRRLVFGALLAGFAAGLAWWTCTTPYAPQRLYAVIPPNATFVTLHYNLAGRADVFLRNPLTRSLLLALGLEEDALAALVRDPESRRWLQRLLARDLIITYTPDLAWTGRPAWIFGGWVGGAGQRLRLTLPLAGDPALRAAGQHGGRTIYELKARDLQVSGRIWFALAEGALIGCISSDPRDLAVILDMYDRRKPAEARRYLDELGKMTCGHPEALDKGWFRVGSGRDARVWAYSLSRLEPLAMAGVCCVNLPLRGPDSAARPADDAALGRLLGNLPLALLELPAATAQDLLRHVPPAWAVPIMETLGNVGGDRLFLAVLGDEYSGRFRGLKVPGLVAGVPGADELVSRQALAALLDKFNRQYRWGLIAQEEPAGERRLAVVESTSGTAYAQLGPRERLAYAFCPPWLLAGSNAETLAALLARHDRSEAQAEARAGPWRAALAAEPNAGFCWLDLDRGGKTLRLVLTAYAMKLLFEDPDRSQDLRGQLNEAKAWIDALAPLRTLSLWLKPDPRQMQVVFAAGAPE